MNRILRYRTELGSLVYLIQDPKKMDKSEWDYFPIAPHIDVRLIPQEGQPLIYEPVAFVSATVCFAWIRHSARLVGFAHDVAQRVQRDH